MNNAKNKVEVHSTADGFQYEIHQSDESLIAGSQHEKPLHDEPAPADALLQVHLNQMQYWINAIAGNNNPDYLKEQAQATFERIQKHYAKCYQMKRKYMNIAQHISLVAPQSKIKN